MIKKNILITGASGTVGFEVLKQLIEINSYSLLVFDKKTKNSVRKFKPYHNKIQIIYGDITNIEDLAFIKNIDVVIHLAAVIPPFADDFPEIAQKVNLRGTRNLLSQLENYSPNAFMMYSSSISVYGDRVLNPYIKVDDLLEPSDGDHYGITKMAAEKTIKDSNLNYTIFRLAAIMGNHKISKLMFHQPLNTALEIATPHDAARAFVNGIEKQKELSRKIFNLGGGIDCRIIYKDFLEQSFAIFGMGKVNFPNHTFAEKNFHCGYYADGDDLEHIVHFRKDTLNDYFKMEKQKVHFANKIVTTLFKDPIKWFLLKKSEPYQAYKSQDLLKMNHYFN
ncbi:nucleoside-diphosphate-sugar epimerase [Flavobacterium sp. PL11]|uniref:NAD-dependent epimerase/dehydratase family protein n=1 Tax=Flavobacterium sp. PL11 TaxID=3071717 RepID=UPI002E05624F|nr:nucleoside-diphosphate-sugar epimerase [Flavobacterium sp. PL11]